MADAKTKLLIEIAVKNQQALGKVSADLDKIKSKSSGLAGAIKAAAGALAAFGAAKLVKSFVDVGSEVENLQLRFKFLFGSAEEGAKAFDTLNSFAATVPFSLGEIAAASGNLAVVSKDAVQLNKNLQITANVAAVAGIDFRTAGEQIQRALSGGIAAADILRERGVRDMLGFAQGATVSAEQTAEAFDRVFGPGGKFGSVADALAGTLTGTLSMINDSFRKFQESVAEGFFVTLKEEFGLLDSSLKENEARIREIAGTIGTFLAKSIKATSTTIQFLAQNINKVTAGFAAIIALNITGKFFAMARAVSAVLVATRSLVALSVVGLAAVAASVAAGTAAYFGMNKIIDELEGKVTESNESFKKQQDEVRANIREQARFAKAVKKSTTNIKEQAEESMTMVQKQREMNETLEETIAGSEELQKIVAANRTPVEAFGDGFKKAMNDGKTAVEQLEDAGARAFGSLTDLVTNFVMTGKFNFKDFARSIIADLVRIAAQAAITFAIKKALAAFGGPVGGFLSGFLADGGPAKAGEAYVVGERGPELFVPNQSGQVVPNEAMTSGAAIGGEVNVNFNINAVDAASFDELLLSRKGLIVGTIQQAFRQQGRRFA